MKGMIRNGYYAKRFLACRAVWFWSAVLALLCTLISYPGIMYSDSYVRITTGSAVLNAMVKTLTGHRAPLHTGNAFTIIPSFFMALSLGITGQVALYTFGQAFAFFAATFLLVRELNPRGRLPQYIFFGCCPLIYGMSVYYEAGIGCVTGIAGLILLFRRMEDEKSRGDRVLEFLLVTFCSFVTFGYRTNALTIVPVLIFYLLRLKITKGLRGLALLALVIGMIGTKALPWIFDVHSLSTASAGIVWEMLTAIQRMPEETQEKYLDYLDDIGGEGATRVALSTSTEDTAGNFMWGEAMGIGKMSVRGATLTAVKKYLWLMTEQPGTWFSVKRDVILRSLGFTWTLDLSEYNYDRWGVMHEYEMNDSLQRHAFYDSFIAVYEGLGCYTLHPWVPFLLTLGLLMIEILRKGAHRGRYLLIYLTAVFYYLAYLLDTPAYDFRYFYPSLYLMMLLDAAMLWRNGERLFALLRKGRKEGTA